MSLLYVTLDVFTSTPYIGNPVAVIHVPNTQDLNQSQKQRIAREFNLSEVVFLHEQSEDDVKNGDVRIRIFTSIAEVPFAGHPTVGTSNYLLRYLRDSTSFRNVKALQTKAGRIPIELCSNGNDIQLKVAHNVRVHNNPFSDRPFAHYPVVSIVKGMTFILAQQPDLDALSKPTQNLLGTENTYKSQHALDEGWQEGLITTYFFADLGMDGNGVRRLRTRMLGSREDPATGSAASALSSYLTLSEAGTRARRYQITQGVEMGRKSVINIEITATEDGKGIEQVMLKGTAVLVMEGKLSIPSID